MLPIPYESSWPKVVSHKISGGSRQKFGGNWRKTATNVLFRHAKVCLLTSPRFFNLEASYLYHLKARGLKLCTWNFQTDRAKNLAEIGEKQPKTGFLLPLSPPTVFTHYVIESYTNREDLASHCAPAHFQADRAKSVGGNWRKNQKPNFSIFRNSSWSVNSYALWKLLVWSCAPGSFTSITPKIWRKLLKNRQNHVSFVPLSTPRCCNIGALYLYHLKALGPKLCTWHFQTDRAKNLAEIGDKTAKIMLLPPVYASPATKNVVTILCPSSYFPRLGTATL